VGEGARLKVVETGAPAGKKLLHYEVTISGKVRELTSGQEFTLNGPVTSIVPKYVKACKVIYQPSGAGYSAIEVKDTQGNAIANGDLVRENTQIIVKVTPQGDHYCKEVTFNGVAKPYNKSNGVEHNVQNDVTIVPVMEELHYFSLQWEKIDGVDMEVRFDNMMGEMVPPGKKFEQLEQGRRVYVKASKEDHYLAGLRVNDDKDPYQLEDWGQWYSFALNTNITAITPVMKPFKKPEAGELLVDYSYEHAEVRVQRVVGGNRVPVPHRSLVPENEDLYITVRNIEGGYRFTCITVNQKIAHVNDQSEYKVKAVDGTLGKKVCKIGVKIDKPSNVPPRYMLVRKAEHGALKVTCTLRNGKKIDEQLTVGKPFFTVSGDEFSATLEPDEGYELGTSVFDGNDVKRNADGSLEFSSTAEQKSLLLLWAAFKATTPKSKLTWEVNGEGSVEVRDEEGNPLKSGVSLPKYAKVTVNVSVDDKHYIERFIVNNVPAGSADDFKSGKFSKRIVMDADKAMQIVFSQKLDPNPPKPSEPSTEVATDLLAEDFTPFHKALYTYHRKGLDIMSQDAQKGKNEILLDYRNTFDLTRGTNLKNEYGAMVFTIEHFLSALYVSGITDLIVELNGNELPICDGSAIKFLDLFQESGVVELDEDIEEIIVKEPVFLSKGDKHVIALPYPDGYKLTYAIRFEHTFLKSQLAEFEITEENYRKEIAPARTFGFDYEVEYLKQNNLALGGTLENAIVIKKDGVLNPDGLRFDDEFVRHKMLDIIGDLKILNRPIRAHIIAIKAGHLIDIEFAKILDNIK